MGDLTPKPLLKMHAFEKRLCLLSPRCLFQRRRSTRAETTELRFVAIKKSSVAAQPGIIFQTAAPGNTRNSRCWF